MERKQLSANMLFSKIFTAIMLIIISAIIISVNRKSPSWSILFVVFIVLYMAFFAFYLPDTIYYDNDYMYVKRMSGEIVVDLKDINTVKLTNATLNRRNFWKVKYTLNGIPKAARFCPHYRLVEVQDFTNQVKLKNPDAEINYSSGFFDFDI